MFSISKIANWDVNVSWLRPFIHPCLVHSMPSDGRLVFASSTASRCCNSHFPVPLHSLAAHLYAFLCTISIRITFEECVTSYPESTTLTALLLDLHILFVLANTSCWFYKMSVGTTLSPNTMPWAPAPAIPCQQKLCTCFPLTLSSKTELYSKTPSIYSTATTMNQNQNRLLIKIGSNYSWKAKQANLHQFG